MEHNNGRQGDMADQAAGNNEVHIQLRLKQTDAKILQAIDEALMRIEKGAFGICTRLRRADRGSPPQRHSLDARRASPARKSKKRERATAFSNLIRDVYLERVSLLMRHEDVAQLVTDYDINNAYQYIIAREQTHLSWLQHALLDLGAPLVNDPPRGPVLSAKGDAWKALAGDDARSTAQFVEKWRAEDRQRVSNARHKGMLKVILGESLEHKRLFDQAAVGRKDLIGTSLDINDHSGDVMTSRWTGRR